MAKTRVIVKGTVQGVGYRALVKFYASQLGIEGLVRNLTDGQVEIFCEGLDERIDQLIKHIDIKSGTIDPSNPNVEWIEGYLEGEENYSPAWKKYDGFEIDYGDQKLTTLEKEALESSENAKLQFWYLRNEVHMLRANTNENFSQMSNKLDEVHKLREDTNENFSQMAAKYGSISSDLKSTREEIKASLKDTKEGIQGAIEDLPEKLKKALIEGFRELDKER